MKKCVSVVACLFFLTFNVKAQSAEDSIKTTINKLFAAMKNGNSKALVECFADSAILQTVVEKNGNVYVQTEPVKDFADFVGTQKQGDADERISFDMVKADGALAVAWTPYKFYYKGNFSHCGIDSYQLVRINGTWKIQYLIDTRRKANCGE